MGLQPRTQGVAASSTEGCSLEHIGGGAAHRDARERGEHDDESIAAEGQLVQHGEHRVRVRVRVGARVRVRVRVTRLHARPAPTAPLATTAARTRTSGGAAKVARLAFGVRDRDRV
jgi:hypothetical protein